MSSGGYSNVFKSASADNLTHVGNDDDFSKHSKVKRLSLETNRRRRELASRLKKEAEKEERRKKEILEQRREKQRQATEKFQRSFSARSRRIISWGPTRPRSPARNQTSELDAMLHMIRTGAPLHRVSSWDSVRHHAWPSQADAADPWLAQDSSRPSPSFEKSPVPATRRSIFEQHLAERQERMAIDQCRSLAEFSQVVESTVDSPPTPRDSLEAPPTQDGEEEDQDSLLDDAMFRPASNVSHIRFVVDAEEPPIEEPEEETIVEDLESGEPKSILKKISAYSAMERKKKPASAHNLAGDVLRDSIEITRAHLDHKTPPESPIPTQRKTVRFAEKLCEELRSPREKILCQTAILNFRRYVTGTSEPPSPKPRRVYGSYASGATAPSQTTSTASKPTPSAPTRLTVTRRVVNKPPAHPNSSPGRKPEKITSAALSKIGTVTTEATEEEMDESSKTPPTSVVTVIPSANQPTLVISSAHPAPSPREEVSSTVPRAFMEPAGVKLSSPAPPVVEPAAPKQMVNGTVVVPDTAENYPLDRTPTEADIEWLWAKVRSCLQRPGSGNPSVAGSVGGDSQTNSELSIQSAPARPVVPMSSQVIDGTSIYPPNFVRNHHRISRQDGHSSRLVHHNVTPHARRVALIRQREMNQYLNRVPITVNNNNSELVQHQQPDMSMTDSMAEFLTNEQICQQSHLFNNSTNSSVSSNQGLLNPVMGSLLTQESPDSKRSSNPPQSSIPVSQNPRQSPSNNTQARRRVFLREQYKPHSLQQQQTPGSYTYTPHPPPARRGSAGPSKRLLSNGYRPISTLSVEEQRLMKSLERINDKLKATTLTK